MITSASNLNKSTFIFKARNYLFYPIVFYCRKFGLLFSMYADSGAKWHIKIWKPSRGGFFLITFICCTQPLRRLISSSNPRGLPSRLLLASWPPSLLVATTTIIPLQAGDDFSSNFSSGDFFRNNEIMGLLCAVLICKQIYAKIYPVILF